MTWVPLESRGSVSVVVAPSAFSFEQRAPGIRLGLLQQPQLTTLQRHGHPSPDRVPGDAPLGDWANSPVGLGTRNAQGSGDPPCREIGAPDSRHPQRRIPQGTALGHRTSNQARGLETAIYVPRSSGKRAPTAGGRSGRALPIALQVSLAPRPHCSGERRPDTSRGSAMRSNPAPQRRTRRCRELRLIVLHAGRFGPAPTRKAFLSARVGSKAGT